MIRIGQLASFDSIINIKNWAISPPCLPLLLNINMGPHCRWWCLSIIPWHHLAVPGWDGVNLNWGEGVMKYLGWDCVWIGEPIIKHPNPLHLNHHFCNSWDMPHQVPSPRPLHPDHWHLQQQRESSWVWRGRIYYGESHAAVVTTYAIMRDAFLAETNPTGY